VMDGLEATRALRADTRFQAIPIIAMTANAMRSELDACLAAGMNDVVTKPIERDKLVATLRKWLPAALRTTVSSGTSQPQNTDRSAAPLPALEGLDVETTLRRLGIDFDSLRRMLLRFATGQVATVDLLAAAVRDGNAPEAARQAHALAGAAGNLGAEELREAAKSLEQAARTGEPLNEHLRAVEVRAAVVFGSIATLESPPEAPLTLRSSGAVDSRQLRAALADLQAAFQTSDPAATDRALGMLLEQGVPEALRQDVERMRRLADDYEFDEAGAIAGRILQTLSEESVT
jgi:two-component system, sensor histidine kinase and response regulator